MTLWVRRGMSNTKVQSSNEMKGMSNLEIQITKKGCPVQGIKSFGILLAFEL
jgi:hypothetical protein